MPHHCISEPSFTGGGALLLRPVQFSSMTPGDHPSVGGRGGLGCVRVTLPQWGGTRGRALPHFWLHYRHNFPFGNVPKTPFFKFTPKFRCIPTVNEKYHSSVLIYLSLCFPFLSACSLSAYQMIVAACAASTYHSLCCDI